jgi:hypothetical protein
LATSLWASAFRSNSKSSGEVFPQDFFAFFATFAQVAGAGLFAE